MLLPYQIHSNSSLQWWMRMYFFTSHDFWQPKFQLITHSVLEKWSVDISVAGWIQSSQLFTRTKRVWLVQVEITKGVVYYSVMCFVRPERKKLSEMEVAPLLTLFTLFTLRILLPLLILHAQLTQLRSKWAIMPIHIIHIAILLWALWRVSVVMGMGWMVWDHRTNDLHSGIRSFINI